MKTTNSFIAVSLSLGLMVSSPFTQASGFQLAEYSATGLGRAYAGEAAIADNASAQWRNPALLTYLQGTQFSAGAVYVNPNVDVDGEVAGSIEAKSDDYVNDAVVPNLYLSHKYNDQLYVGLAFGTNYGMITDLGSNFSASHLGNKAKVETIEANLNLGYQLTKAVSLGGGLRYITGEGHFGGSLGGTTLKYMEGDDTAFGWQIGTAWQINPNHRIGIAYKSAVDLTLAGHAEGLAYGGTLPGSMDITLPATAELATFHQLTQRWAVHTSFNWTDWSTFDKLVANVGYTDPIKIENWRDSYRFALGTTYALSNTLTLRSGLAYDTSAVSDSDRTITIPEIDRTWFSIGASYAFSTQLNFDIGATYVYTKDAHIIESDEDLGVGSFEGNVSGNIIIFGLQANYVF